MVSEGKIHVYIMGNTGTFHKLQVRNHQNKSKQVVWLPYGQFSIGWHDMLKSFQEKGMLGLRETSQTEGYDLQCTQHKIQTHYHLPCPTAIYTIYSVQKLGMRAHRLVWVPGCGSGSWSSTARSWRAGWVWWARSPDSGAPDPWTPSAHGHSAAQPASYSWRRTDSWGERTGITRGTHHCLHTRRSNTLKRASCTSMDILA